MGVPTTFGRDCSLNIIDSFGILLYAMRNLFKCNGSYYFQLHIKYNARDRLLVYVSLFVI